MLLADGFRLDHSWVDEARARFARTNDPLVMQTRALLGRLIADSRLHSRLTNTLSLLEHIGCHKIVTTQHSLEIEHATLRHIAEEAHHAQFMRRQAEKLAGRPLEYATDDLLGPATARMYFRRLEARLLQRLRREHSAAATYLYVSLVIEFRALWFYRLYDQALRAAQHPLSLKRILGEEEHHLNDMTRRLDAAGELSDTRLDEFVALEHRLYETLLAGFRRALQTEPV